MDSTQTGWSVPRKKGRGKQRCDSGHGSLVERGALRSDDTKASSTRLGASVDQTEACKELRSLPRPRNGYPNEVAIRVSHDEVTVAPRSLTRFVNDLGANGLHPLEKVVEAVLDPELRLHRRRKTVRCFVTSEEMDRHSIAGEDGVHRDFVAWWVYDPRLESEHSAIPVDGRRDVRDGEYRVDRFHSMLTSRVHLACSVLSSRRAAMSDKTLLN